MWRTILDAIASDWRRAFAGVADPTIALRSLAALGLRHSPAAFAPAHDPPQVDIA